MPVQINHTEYISGSPEAVFNTGTQSDTLPEMPGLAIVPKSDRIVKDGEIDVRVELGAFLVKHVFKLNGFVTEFEPPNHIVIEGESHIGKIAVGLDLAKENDRTRVDYSVLIDNNAATKIFEPAVRSQLGGKKGRIAGWAKRYKENVDARLDGRRLPYPRRPKRK